MESTNMNKQELIDAVASEGRWFVAKSTRQDSARKIRWAFSMPTRPGLRPSPFVLHMIEVLDKEVDKRPHLGGQVLPVLVSNIDLQSGQIPIVENRHEAPSHEVIVNDVHGLDHDTETVQASLADDLSFIGFQQTVDLDGMGSRALRESKLVGVIGERVDQETVTLEFLE